MKSTKDATPAERVVITVVRLIGAVAILLTIGYVTLLRDVILQAGEKGSVDPSAIAAIAALGPLVGGAVTGLASLLSSTRSSDAPARTEIVNTPENAVPVETADSPVEPGPGDA